MADIPVSQEEQALRRRARRRLVGAIALALLAVVVLPMLFDPEPKPLGGNVEIQIPGPDTPFASPPVALAPAAEPYPDEAGQAAAVEEPPPPELPLTVSEPKPLPVKPVVSKPAAVKPVQTKPVEAKPVKPSPAPATDAVYLQLGVFSSAGNARQLAEKVKTAGFQASVVSSGSQNKVRMGPYADRDQAMAAQAKLKAKNINSVLTGP